MNALETWLQKPAYSYMRGQQTGLQANDDCSKMKKKNTDENNFKSINASNQLNADGTNHISTTSFNQTPAWAESLLSSSCKNKTKKE